MEILMIYIFWSELYICNDGILICHLAGKEKNMFENLWNVGLSKWAVSSFQNDSSLGLQNDNFIDMG